MLRSGWSCSPVGEMKLLLQVDLEGDGSDVGMHPPVDVESGNVSADGAGVGPPALAQMTNLRKVILCLSFQLSGVPVCYKTRTSARLVDLCFKAFVVTEVIWWRQVSNLLVRSRPEIEVSSAGVWPARGCPQPVTPPACWRGHSPAGTQRRRCGAPCVAYLLPQPQQHVLPQ